MTVAERCHGVFTALDAAIPNPETELHYSNPYELLVAVILSAQCTDKRVNIVTPPLFRAYPTPEALAEADADTLYTYIRSVSYPNNKTRSLLGMARCLVDRYSGRVPDTLDDLLTIPGVGRKTANVMLAVAFNTSAMPVDTHVYRVSRRIGLVPLTADTPRKVEDTLTRRLKALDLGRAHHLLILHGRYTCRARNPLCGDCPVAPFCREHARNTPR